MRLGWKWVSTIAASRRPRFSANLCRYVTGTALSTSLSLVGIPSSGQKKTMECFTGWKHAPPLIVPNKHYWRTPLTHKPTVVYRRNMRFATRIVRRRKPCTSRRPHIRYRTHWRMLIVSMMGERLWNLSLSVQLRNILLQSELAFQSRSCST